MRVTTPAWLKVIPVAHRGLHSAADGRPENSRAAFAAAADAGYAAELDVQLSSDGVVMVLHDTALKRLLGQPGDCATTSAAALGTMTILGSRETVPTLRQVLAEMAGRAPLLIEIKASFPDDHAALAQAVAAELDGYAGPYAVQSFHPGVVDWFRLNRPAMPRGQIASAAEDYRDMAPPLRDALMRRLDDGFGAPHFIAFDIRYLPSPLTERARDAGLPVLTWTVRTAEHKARARAHADNVIFEGCQP